MNTIPTEIFDQLYKDNYRKLIAYAYRILKEEQASEDAVQETFVRLAKQDYENLKDKIMPWMFTVCRNLCFKFLDKRKRFIEIKEGEEDFEKIDESRDPSEEFDMNVYKKVLKRYMKKLTKRQRDILRLRFFKGFDYKECAAKLKTTSGNVGFHQTTAIQTLRKMMDKYINA